jgi:hypothetical protein
MPASKIYSRLFRMSFLFLKFEFFKIPSEEGASPKIQSSRREKHA